MTTRYPLFVFILVAFAAPINGAQPPAQPPRATAVRKLGGSAYAIGEIQVDLARHELTVPATTNDAMTLEFVACTKGGFKAYESALTVDTDAISFNTALLLLGLDPKHARVPTRHFDPVAPAGDAVELSIEWGAEGERHRAPIEQLLFDRRTSTTLPEGQWVYTGSTFLRDTNGDRYMADIDGVLIGFVHSPSPIIENPRAGAVNAYGFVVFNRNLGLAPGTAVTLTVRAVPSSSQVRR